MVFFAVRRIVFGDWVKNTWEMVRKRDEKFGCFFKGL